VRIGAIRCAARPSGMELQSEIPVLL